MDSSTASCIPGEIAKNIHSPAGRPSSFSPGHGRNALQTIFENETRQCGTTVSVAETCVLTPPTEGQKGRHCSPAAALEEREGEGAEGEDKADILWNRSALPCDVKEEERVLWLIDVFLYERATSPDFPRRLLFYWRLSIASG